MTAALLQFLAISLAGSAALVSGFGAVEGCDEDEAISILGVMTIGAVFLMVAKVGV